jgi:hypothetical protein
MDIRVNAIIDEFNAFSNINPPYDNNAEILIKNFVDILVEELEGYSNRQYRKYTTSSSKLDRANPYVLGTSEGTDKCIEVIKELLV